MLHVLNLEDRLNPASPLGSLDSIYADFVVRGWAFDPDSPSVSSHVHMYIDGQPVTDYTTDQPRLDVNNYFNITGSHGYAVVVPFAYNDGQQHTVDMYAIDVQGGSNPLIGHTTFRNQPTVGFWERLSPDGYVSGWGFDPDNKTGLIRLDMYINGAYVTSAVSDQYRGDVNAVYGLSGNHGFGFQIPSAYRDGFRRDARIYAVDGATQNTGAVNTQIGDMPFANGNQFIQGSPMAGGPIQIGTTESFAGAVASLTWNDKQFVNTSDHGREFQSALNANPNPNTPDEVYNPTEAGSRTDASGQTSSSTLNYAVANGNNLQTLDTMAFWNPYQGVVQSNYLLYKSITIGFQDLPNVVRYNVSFHVPQSDRPFASFATLACYMPPEFNTFFTYNPASGQRTHITNPALYNVNEQTLPLIFSTADGQYAMALITEATGAAAPGQPGLLHYANFNLSATGYTASSMLMSTAFRSNNVTAGDYVFTHDVIIGNLAMVQNTLDTMRYRVPIAFS